MDFDMASPADSIIWSPSFLGNGDGFVTTGPFSNWQTSSGRLTRNVGGASRVVSKADIRAVMSRCRTREIIPPTAQRQFDLELAHGGPHVWIGGQMSGLNTAAHDPVFFMHHAFIDYIWEIFRNRQAFSCGVNPETDYPEIMGQHASLRPMDGLPPYRNIDGYMNYWTRFWYRYERAPTCSRRRPFCGSPYLRCDGRRGRCISVARPTNTNANAAVMGMARGFGGAAMRGMPGVNRASAVRAAREESSIRIGPRFRAPPSDGRTNNAILRRNRFRRSSHGTVSNATSPFAPIFRHPPSDDRPMSRSSVSVSESESQFSQSSSFDLFSESFPLIPSVDFSFLHRNTTSTRDNPLSSASMMKQKTEGVSMKAFIPVNIAYVRTHEDVIQRFTWLEKKNSTSSDSKANSYPECRPKPYIKAKVTIQSNGINNMEVYTSEVEVDTSLPVVTRTTYIRVKPPRENMATMTMLSAFHECGLMCQPTCPVRGSSPTKHTACTGLLRVAKGDKSVLYGTSLKAAFDNRGRGQGQSYRDAPMMKFHCTNADVSSWSQLPYGPTWIA